MKSIAALKAGLGKTLMERIVERKPECVTLLQVQYRMNDDIMRFSSDWFYGGKVKTAPQISHRGILDLDYPIDWIDTSQMEVGPDEPTFKEQFVGESFGRVNKGEANLTLQTLEQYFTKIGKQRVIDEQIDVGSYRPIALRCNTCATSSRSASFSSPSDASSPSTRSTGSKDRSAT